MRIAIGIDTGGTCTDAVVYDFETNKVLAKGKTLTTREDLSVCISKVLDMLPEEYVKTAKLVSLSTTLATNACVENKGGRAKLMMFGLTQEMMQRLKVSENYGIKPDFVKCIDTHSSADGTFIDEPNWDNLFLEYDKWISECDGMAVAELYGPSTGAPCEKKFKKLVGEKYNIPCIGALDLTDKVDVIQRGATALLDARLLPIIKQFIDIATEDIKKRGCTAPIMVVRSDGSLMGTEATGLKPVETILSGPAASILAGKALTSHPNYMIVDMGGTTTDVSLVLDGETKKVGYGIKIGGWKTSVDGVFVDTFALGGDSTIRWEKNQIKLLDRRSIPMCVATVRWPDLKRQLKELTQSGDWGKFPLYECLILNKTPEDKARYSKHELELIDALSQGPCTLKELRDVHHFELYNLKTDRLEDENIIIRAALTPTDFMHIKGDYVEYDTESSLMAAKYVLLCKVTDFNNLNKNIYTEEAFMAMAEEAYDAVQKKMYFNLARILIEQDYPKLYEKMSTDLHTLIEESWIDFKAGRSSLSGLNFSTKMMLLGMGAPTHVFLPKVAEALGSRAIFPDNAEVGNAIGAVMAEIEITSDIEISQWDRAGSMHYIVHSHSGSIEFDKLEEATSFAEKTAIEEAIKEARLRGAQAELHPIITHKEYNHSNATLTALVFGGVVTAKIRCKAT